MTEICSKEALRWMFKTLKFGNLETFVPYGHKKENEYVVHHTPFSYVD